MTSGFCPSLFLALFRVLSQAPFVFQICTVCLHEKVWKTEAKSIEQIYDSSKPEKLQCHHFMIRNLALA